MPPLFQCVAQEMQMRVVKAAAVQLSPVLYSRDGTVAKIVQQIRQLGTEGVQFATFPETVVPYYPYFSFIQPAHQIISGRQHLELLEQAVTISPPAVDAIGEACKKRREWSRPSVSTSATAGRSTTRNCCLTRTVR